MKKIVLFLLVAFFYLGAKAQDTKLFFKKAPHTIIADGNVNDWGEKPFVLYNIDTKLKYGFACDDKNIYLCYRAEERSTQLRIIRAGMNISLMVKAAKKANIKIEYPIKDDAFEQKMSNAGAGFRPMGDTTAMRRFQRGDSNRVRIERDDTLRARREFIRMDSTFMGKIFLETQTNMNLTGFVGENGTQPINREGEVNVCIRWDSTNAMIYEIVIPLSKISADPNFSIATIKEVSLKTEIGVMEMQGNTMRMQGGTPPAGNQPVVISYGGGDGPHSGGGRIRGGFDPVSFSAPAISTHKIYVEP